MVKLFFDLGIFLAALGITTLEMVEAAAVGLALYADSKKVMSFVVIALGALVVFAPTFVVGGLISYLPVRIIRAIGGVLLLYFGLRLIKSARKTVLRERSKKIFVEEFTKGLAATGFSVGAIEAFEASIVMIGLLPNNFNSTSLGFAVGIVAVIVSTYVLRKHVRKVKQAVTKVFVSALLLSFATFWFAEIALNPNDLFLVPLFVIFAAIVYFVANRPSPAVAVTPQ
ncbi:MAG: hypothetical protein ABSE82_12585 [Nitrososphaerales archaeon]|jgi:uncharacterized membrane protein